jgi:DnaK suppressor protein
LVRCREELIEQMRGELAYSRGNQAGARYDDVCDRAADAFYDELAQGFAEIASADLKMIERAIQKIDGNSYGLCEICGSPIPGPRLRALPFADLCVECKRQEEAAEERVAAPVRAPLPPEND